MRNINFKFSAGDVLVLDNDAENCTFSVFYVGKEAIRLCGVKTGEIECFSRERMNDMCFEGRIRFISPARWK